MPKTETPSAGNPSREATLRITTSAQAFAPLSCHLGFAFFINAAIYNRIESRIMADSNTGGNNESQSTTNSKFTRCRTGCLRCRKRRRKCDEHKPRCQNCIDKNFDCNYGMQVTFLPKNSITVTAGDLKAPQNVDSAGVYDRIQFVNEDPLSTDTLAGDGGSGSVELSTERARSPTSTSGVSSAALSPPSRNTSRQNESRRYSTIERERERYNHDSEINANNERRDYSYHENRSIFAPWELDDPTHTHTQSLNLNPPVTLEPPIMQTTFSAKDEFAVQGLLALGTQSGSGPGPGPVIPAFIENPDPTIGGGGHGTGTVTPNRMIGRGGGRGGISPGIIDGIISIPTPAPQSVLNSDIRNSITGSSSSSNSEAWKMKLLQHFRYIVAPWLDICDLNHPFGITALQTAVTSTSDRLLPALMALSEACMQRVGGGRGLAVRFDDSTASVYFEQPCSNHLDLDIDVHPDSTEDVLLNLFKELQSLVSDVGNAWAENCEDYSPLQRLVHGADGMGLESAVYWVFLRIGKSLANNTPLPNLTLLYRSENTHERVAHYAQALLWLCGKALTIYLYHQDSHRVQAPNRDTWLQVFDKLSQWHYLRPQEFQPMVMIELHSDDRDQDQDQDQTQTLNPGSQFPMLLFTNGAGVLCNQLYHTAMLLMLECKPRTALPQSHGHSPVLSALWHAQRICGIALNNDRREWWDPCLLASFLVAARYMTHESQQVEIVRGFERIRGLTGWSVGEYLTQVREEWSFLDGVE
ncbi:hypothetical protein BDW59DRAFT_158923 [Aspergillus cavernicola]|uniref:Zn(2)-C6 fungal-type domain-containing protein n=1 Tax=Aspergillus cavernicola TaxID=176166 RepID=A0ABR4IPQ9_9EURO